MQSHSDPLFVSCMGIKFNKRIPEVPKFESGRLGDPNLELRDDDRGDPLMREAVVKWGLEGRKEPSGLVAEHKSAMETRDKLLRQIGKTQDTSTIEECEAIEKSLNKVSTYISSEGVRSVEVLHALGRILRGSSQRQQHSWSRCHHIMVYASRRLAFLIAQGNLQTSFG